MDWRFVLVLAFGITNSQKSLDRAYTPDREYVYEYEAQVATGMPESTNFYSGLKIKCQTHFQFKTISRVTMKLEQIRLFKLNNFVEGEDPTKEQINGYEEITGDEAKWMSTYLTKPVMFKYMRGHIQEIKGEKDDEFWSMNVKRGILSLLEMNFEERRSASTKERLVELNRDRSSPVDYYRVMEPSVVGDCETSYYIETDVPKENDKYMYLTKVRNYLNCLERPFYTRSIYNAMRCAQCESEKTEPFKSAAQVRYVMKGDKRRFIVYSAIGESQHMFTPYSPEGGNVASFINQTFVLMDQRDIQRPIPGPQSPKSYTKGLQAESKQEDKPKSPLTSRLPTGTLKRTPEERKQLIMRYIDMIVAYTKEDIKEEATSMTFTFADELRNADSDLIRDIWGQYKEGKDKSNDEKYYKWKLMLDTLPALGTPSAVEVLVDYIKKSEIPPEGAVHALIGLTVTASPDINIAKYLLELVRDQNVRSHEAVLRSAYLTLGAMADRIRSENDRRRRELERKERKMKKLKDRENKKYIRDQLDSKLVDVRDEIEQTSSVFSRFKMEIIQEIRSMMTSKPEYMMYAMKTIGNAGYPEFIPDCKSVLEDRSKPQIIRTQAVYSLRKITAFAPEAVRSLLFPYFMDQEEVEEVRIGSYLVMTGTNPSRAFLEMLAQSLYRENNPHVGTFVYTHLEQISNSTHPCLMSWARNASFALRFAKKYNPSFQYSRFLHYSTFSDRLKMGGALEMGYVSSPREFIPRSGAIHANMHILGYSSNIMEVGFNSEGLQTLANQLLRSPGQPKEKSVRDVLRPRHSRESDDDDSDEESLRPSKRVKDIQKQLNVSPRETSDTKGHIYFKLFNNEINYFDIREWLEKCVRKGIPLLQMMSQGGVDLNIYKSAMFMDGQYSWFTELGFPIHYKLRGSTSFKVGGSWKLDMAVKNKDKYPELKFEITPSMALQMRGVVETDFYYFKSGAAMTSQFQYGTPVSFSVSTDSKKYFFNLDFKKVKENFMQSEMSPAFYVEHHYIDATKVPFEDLKYIEHMDGAMVIPTNYEYGNYEWGLVFGMKGQMVFRNFNKRLPFYPFYGRNKLQYTVRPGTNPPSAAEFQFSSMSSEELEESSQSQSEESQKYKPVPRDESKDPKGLFNSLMSLLFRRNEKEQSEKPERRRPMSRDQEPNLHRDDQMSSREKQRPRPDAKFDWYGFEFRLVGVGSKPERWLQCDWRYKPMPSDQSHVFDFKYSRTPFPEKENKPYNIDIKGTFKFPTAHIEPRSLLDPSYQKDIQRLVRTLIQQQGDVEGVKQILKVKSRKQSDKTVKKLQQPEENRRDLKSLIEDQIEESRNSRLQNVQAVISLLKQQKQVSRELRHLSKQRHNVLESSTKATKLKDLFNQMVQINEEISKQLDDKSIDNRKGILLSALVLRQQENQRRISKIVKHLNGNLDKTSIKDLEERRNEMRKDVDKLLEKQSDAVVYMNADRTVHSPIKSLETEQAKVLKELSKSQKQDIKEELEKLEKRTKDTLLRIPLDSSQPRQRLQTALFLKVMVQHQQVLEALKRWDESRRLQQNLREKQFDRKDQDQDLKEVVKRLRQRTSGIVLIKQLKKEQRDAERNPEIDTVELKKVSKLRLRQLQISLPVSTDAPIRHDEAKSTVQKLKEISNEVAEEADKVEEYSPLVGQLLVISESQIELLEVVKQSLQAESDINLNEEINKDLQRNVEIQSKLQKRVELNAKSSIPKPNFDAWKLISAIKMDQKLFEDLNRSGEKQALKELLREIVEKMRRSVDAASRIPDKEKRCEALNSIQKVCVKQEILLRTLQSHISSSERLHQQTNLKELQDKIKREIEKQTSSGQSSDRNSEERRDQLSQESKSELGVRDNQRRKNPKEQNDQQGQQSNKLGVRYDQPKESSEPRVHVLKEIRRIAEEAEQKINDAEIPREQNERKRQSIKDAVRLMKEATAIASTHPDITVPQKDLNRLKDKLEDIKSISKSVIKSKSGLQLRLSSEIQVLQDELNKLLKVQQTSSEEKGDKRESLRSYDGMFFNLDFVFGYTGQISKTIHIQGKSMKSLEQLLWEGRQGTPDKDELVQRYIEDRDSPDSYFRESYKQLKRELNSFRHYDFVGMYNKADFDPEYRMMWWRFQEFIKYAWYRHAWFDMPKETSDRIEVMLDFRKNNIQADITLHSPLETDRFFGVNLPWYYSDLCYSTDSLRYHGTMPRSVPLLSLAEKLPGECVLRKQSVKTLDGHVMKLPKTGSCDVVLVMDCSSSAKFSVKARQDDKNPEKKDIILDVEKRNIEVVIDKKPTLYVDGKELELKEEKLTIVARGYENPIEVQREPRKNSQKLEEQLKDALVKVSMEGENIIIEIPKEGVQIVSSHDEIRVKVSPLHYSKVCGLCGNYDGIPRNDKENPQKQEHKSPSCVIADLIVPSKQCDSQSIEDQCKKEQPNSPESCEPQQRQVVKTVQRGEKQQVCFSEDPVNECQPGCQEVKPRGKVVQLKCLDRDSRQAQILLSQSHHRPLPEIKSLPVTEDDRIKADVKEPYSCRRN